ncbi:hypothetical protein FF38_03253 [Lucilia cuprina]|uniref:Uncharacterized protein n=1 Tax=Lucilia cuprina TaxID=7375 RepID=A0A0L0CJ16_LUCCU|nr:hypothetical protein FF38_03253 [Lucilia cuprina]
MLRFVIVQQCYAVVRIQDHHHHHIHSQHHHHLHALAAAQHCRLGYYHSQHQRHRHHHHHQYENFVCDDDADDENNLDFDCFYAEAYNVHAVAVADDDGGGGTAAGVGNGHVFVLALVVVFENVRQLKLHKLLQFQKHGSFDVNGNDVADGDVDDDDDNNDVDDDCALLLVKLDFDIVDQLGENVLKLLVRVRSAPVEKKEEKRLMISSQSGNSLSNVELAYQRTLVKTDGLASKILQNKVTFDSSLSLTGPSGIIKTSTIGTSMEKN